MISKEEEIYSWLMKIREDLNTGCEITNKGKFLTLLEDFANDSINHKFYPGKTIFYRARIYKAKDRYKKYNNPEKGTYQGYDKNNSFVNQNPPASRANVDGQPVLYTSTTVKGSLIEVKPYAESLISVAKIKTKEELKVLDFSSNMTSASGEDGLYKARFFNYINRQFLSPCYEKEDYLLTQYISEYARSKNFDGISYCSAYSRNCLVTDNNPYKNIAIFNYKKCEAINSKLYMIDKVICKYHKA